MKRLFAQAGFTMIELLVVIAVIGVLAVAVISSINPIEQINKGRDTRTRSDAAQLINAVDRFYATQEKYPWNDGDFACGETPCSQALSAAQESPAMAFPAGTTTEICVAEDAVPGMNACKIDDTYGAWLYGLVSTSEVKESFVSRIQAQSTYAIYVYKEAGADATLYACFQPSSKAFQQEAVDNCQDNNIAGSWSDELKELACPGEGTVGQSGEGGYTASTAKQELICLP